jgi:hypothetical protein
VLYVSFLTADLKICVRPSSLGVYSHKLATFQRSFHGYQKQLAVGAV